MHAAVKEPSGKREKDKEQPKAHKVVSELLMRPQWTLHTRLYWRSPKVPKLMASSQRTYGNGFSEFWVLTQSKTHCRKTPFNTPQGQKDVTSNSFSSKRNVFLKAQKHKGLESHTTSPHWVLSFLPSLSPCCLDLSKEGQRWSPAFLQGCSWSWLCGTADSNGISTARASTAVTWIKGLFIFFLLPSNIIKDNLQEVDEQPTMGK